MKPLLFRVIQRLGRKLSKAFKQSEGASLLADPKSSPIYYGLTNSIAKIVSQFEEGIPLPK